MFRSFEGFDPGKTLPGESAARVLTSPPEFQSFEVVGSCLGWPGFSGQPSSNDKSLCKSASHAPGQVLARRRGWVAIPVAPQNSAGELCQQSFDFPARVSEFRSFKVSALENSAGEVRRQSFDFPARVSEFRASRESFKVWKLQGSGPGRTLPGKSACRVLTSPPEFQSFEVSKVSTLGKLSRGSPPPEF